MPAPDQLQAALIGDVVVSRRHPDQVELLREVREALDSANDQVSGLQPLSQTVGDEFQGSYATVAAALDAALHVRLRLAGRHDVRFGVGWGEITAYDPQRAPMGQSGSAWWAAREAIERVAALETRRQWPRTVRTLVAGLGEPLEGAVNAFLLCRDSLLGRMDVRDLRVTLGLLLGERQVDVAQELGIRQPSVARRQMENGASAVYRAHLELRGMAS